MVPGADHPADRLVPVPSGPVGHQFGALPEQAHEERLAGVYQRQAQVSQGGDRQEDLHAARPVQPGERQGEAGPGIWRRRLQPKVVRLPVAVFPQRSVPVPVAADQQLFAERRHCCGGVRQRGRAKREYSCPYSVSFVFVMFQRWHVGFSSRIVIVKLKISVTSCFFFFENTRCNSPPVEYIVADGSTSINRLFL